MNEEQERRNEFDLRVREIALREAVRLAAVSSGDYVAGVARVFERFLRGQS